MSARNRGMLLDSCLVNILVSHLFLFVVTWQTLPLLGDAGLYILYVWSGVLITLVLVEFWVSMGAAVPATA